MRRRSVLLGGSLLVGGCLRLSSGGPTAAFTYSPQDPVTGEVVTFDAGASEDPDGEIVQYSWVLLDENDEPVSQFGSTVTATHTFDEPGDHRVGLEVIDDEGTTARTAQTVVVHEA